MTIEQRKEVYQAALSYFQEGYNERMLCVLLTDIAFEKGYYPEWATMLAGEEEFPEFFKCRPLATYSHIAWWGKGEEGYNSRMRALHISIVDCDLQLKKTL